MGIAWFCTDFFDFPDARRRKGKLALPAVALPFPPGVYIGTTHKDSHSRNVRMI